MPQMVPQQSTPSKTQLMGLMEVALQKAVSRVAESWERAALCVSRPPPSTVSQGCPPSERAAGVTLTHRRGFATMSPWPWTIASNG